MTARALEEWIGKDADTDIPPRVKVRIVDRQDNRCDECKRPFGARLKPEFDHRPALVNSGENRESKIVAVCEHCHADRTSGDVAEKSKTYKLRAKYLGIDLKPKWKRGFR